MANDIPKSGQHINRDQPASITPIFNRVSPSEKQKKAMFAEAFKQIEIHSVADIREIISNMLQNAALDGEKTTISADLSGINDVEGKGEVYQTHKVDFTGSNVSIYSLLIEGMDTVKARMVAAEKAKAAYEAADEPAQFDLWDINNMKFNVDNLIKRKLGGVRHNLRVRWTLPDQIIEFDPYTKKLYKVDQDASEQPN